MTYEVNSKLEIIIITYNRSKCLEKTLLSIFGSEFSCFKVTVLNNNSTDNTIEICEKFETKYSNFSAITNKVNIGANANVMKAFEISNGIYSWIICDDDEFDFSNAKDILEVLIEERVDLIHMGAHEIEEWSPSGVFMTPKDLMKNGYKYFLYGSFLPCNLFRTTSFYPTIIGAYDNIPNMYPHMPFVFDFFLNDKIIYVSKTRIVKATMSGQSYNYIKWFEAWTNTCLLLPKEYRRLAFYDQFFNTTNFQLMKNFALLLSKQENSWIFIMKLFSILNGFDRLSLLIFLPIAKIYRIFKNK